MNQLTQQFPKPAARALYLIAADQNGYFTTKQALQAGYSDQTHPYHVKNGDWVRENRGIYRLTNFPQSGRPELVFWHLWSRDRNEQAQGTFSHATALDVYEISDLMPDKVHMTVPKSFRKGQEIPSVLDLHYGDLTPEEIRNWHGVPVTTPLRTIADILCENSIPQSMLKDAFTQAIDKGLIAKKEIEKMNISVADEVKEQLFGFYEKVKDNRRKTLLLGI